MFWQDRRDQDDNIFVVDGGESYTYREIFDRGDSIFSDLNPSKGVALIAGCRDFDFVSIYCGALRSNIVPFVVDPTLTLEVVGELLERYKVEYFFSEKNADFPNYVAREIDCGYHLYCRNENVADLLFPGLKLLLLTSGSTGDAKSVRLSSENINICTESVVRYMELNENSVSVSSLPFHYTFGLSILHCAMHARAKILLTSLSWLDKEFWALAAGHAVTELSGVPFMFEMLRRFKVPGEVLENLRCVSQAGGRLAPDITKHFLEFFGREQIKYFTMYGQTEAAPRISYVPIDRASEKLGSIGCPIDIGKFRTDADNGRDRGELIYSGPNVCLGYGIDRSDLAVGDVNGGVLKTGDIAEIDTDGFAYIVGRKKRFVKVYGISVNLDEIERLAKSVVSTSAVIGEDDKVLILATEDRTDDLKARVQSRINFPARALKVIKVDEVFYLNSGKIDYQRMREQYL